MSEIHTPATSVACELVWGDGFRARIEGTQGLLTPLASEMFQETVNEFEAEEKRAHDRPAP